MSGYDPAVSGRSRAPTDYSTYPDQAPLEDARSPISNILRNLGTNQKQTKDGQPQKRRGPKPDSKPALTRRQELNRQAQRTHRERKEQYTKALENEVMRIKELYTGMVQERDVALADNNRLREMLKAHGIQVDLATPSTSYNATMPSYASSNGGSMSTGYRHDSNATALSQSPLNGQSRSPPQMQTGHAAQIPGTGMDYDQLGIDFILTLERPCMDHMQYLVVRSHNVEGQPFHHPMERTDDSEHDHMSGHALMATCPPWSHVMGKPEDRYPHQMPEVPHPELMKLLEASHRLPTDGGEVTPVQAWMLIIQNERITSLSKRDIEMVQATLVSKVRCYGFGAVLEEFEVRDAVDAVLAGRISVPAVNGVGNAVHAHNHAHHHQHVVA
ncbi:hypothetical protein K461DRAFT_21427 [Myriangium duriaei CBS 260.36]|uniref:BZIP domain-containing protein n=1 Tax=Myriangium duriaei CBS 260.36 TaxID=1168546 RepID=A0A9P4JEM6_9PEZI|nr:hypothetical protein K461DRAFT_21427 [Myriangium duriaei CBS 260.36]